MIYTVVVDDEIDARDKMVNVISSKSSGIEIVGTASNGWDAFDLINREKPDVVLIDIEMPGMNGLDVIRKCRKEEFPTVFVIISSHHEFGYARDAISLNVVDYLLKPFLPSDLFDAIYRAANRVEMMKKLPHMEEPDTSGAGTLFSMSPSCIFYPADAEKEVVNAIILGDEAQIRSSLELFFGEVSAQNATTSDINHCYISLYVSLVHMVWAKEINIETFTANMSQLSTVDEQQFREALAGFCIYLSTKFNQSNVSSTVIARAMKYIDEHYREELTLANVAEKVFVSPNYLSRLFMRSLNIHFTDYIHQVRVKEAQHLIRDCPHLKNYEISDAVGFNSVKYFSSVFQKVTGMNISQYRSQLSPGP